MIIGIGTDIVRLSRIEKVLEAHGERFRQRCYAAEERETVDTRAKGDKGARAAGYAKRWAAKEACAKALGLGIREQVFLKDIAVINDGAGKPSLRLTGGAKDRLTALTPRGMTSHIYISLSDEAGMALAFVVISAAHGEDEDNMQIRMLTEDAEQEQQMTQAAPSVEVTANTAPVKEKDDAVELLKAMAFAAVIALVIRSFLFEPFNIPSSSMVPTLKVGDYLFVEKWAYGYSSYSFPLDIVPITGRIFEKPVTRGDVVVFRQPKMVGVDYIKRIIGLPGDTIQVKEGRLWINGKMVQRVLENDETYLDENNTTHVFRKYTETLPPDDVHPKGLNHFIYELSDNEELDNTPEYVVPAGHYFAMGDNRDESADSRVMSQVGFVPAENVIGHAVMIFFSSEGIGDKCDRDGVFGAIEATGCKLVEWPKSIRYSRIFRFVSSF